ncbi:ATP-grasp domain-containing protein [Falsiroseomonas ponticola]|uniref:ATP-grasp domain-containing protein n=1 Tax=Falsiroseomonas ponticola TaxID=2786951 RepID=UPI00193411B5|nr:ATP-grasp domain-containing protein [Roseomonas ponticola]
MRLTEWDGKVALRRHGIALPDAVLIRDDAAPAGFGDAVVKAQLLEGGRGKRGLVRRAEGDVAGTARAIRGILGDATAPLMLEQPVAIAQEIFLALRVDGTAQAIEVLCAPEGGVEVESGAPPLRFHLLPEAPGAIATALRALRTRFAPDLAARLARLALRLARVMVAEDLESLEINPLARLADGSLVACDCKAVRDEAASFRHDAAGTALSAALEEAALTPLERRARDQGFQMVEIPGGRVAMVTAGAGLGMMMLDLLGDAGCPAACFMDNAQGGPAETAPQRFAAAFEMAERPGIDAVLFYTTLASRPLKGRVEALAAALREKPSPKPLFVGLAAGHAALAGYSMERAAADLAAVGVTALEADPHALVRRLAEAIGPRL